MDLHNSDFLFGTTMCYRAAKIKYKYSNSTGLLIYVLLQTLCTSTSVLAFEPGKFETVKVKR
jgi:hypothetical protein